MSKTAGELKAALLCSLGLALAAWTDQPAAAPLTPLQVGERIYKEGLLPSGKPVPAEWFEGVPLAPHQSACVACHRPSGMGSIEGTIVVPSVVGHLLFQPGKVAAVRFGTSYDRRAARPAYADDTLALAIREGVDPAGQPLAAPMPRYRLDDGAMAALIAYLKSLSIEAAPGVTDQEIHLATVVTDGLPAERRKTMLEVLEAYVAERNAGSRSQSRQTAPGVWTISERRRWRIHVWELHGRPADWPAQLAAHYQRQPVFALVSGLAAGSWQPVHDFCDANRLPCLFPSTDLPGQPAAGGFSLYFSRGVALEAAALAQHLHEVRPRAPVVQVLTDDPRSQAAAAALRRELARLGMAPPRDLRLSAGMDVKRRLAGMHGGRRPTLVLWLPRPELQTLAALADQFDRIVLSDSLLEQAVQADEGLAGKVVAIRPFVLPDRKERQLLRLRAWLVQRGIPPGDERIQSEAYFAANAVLVGLSQIGDVYSRDYFLERIEDMTEDLAGESIYPRTTLGPGQRHVAKGAYLVTVPADGHPGREIGWYLP